MKKYFVPVNASGETLGVWFFDGNLAVRVGVPDPMKHENSHVAVASGQDLIDAMKNKLKAWFEHGKPCVLKDMTLTPGQYYNRMARPSDQHPKESPGNCPEPKNYQHEIAISRGQLGSLKARLQEIFQTVHPHPDTFNTYGHEIRNLLILACTEVEAQWKGTLEANGVSKPRYSTNDYVQLNSAMLLDQYGVSLPHYPWLPVFQPFKGWGSSGKPTQDLAWYDAYNKVKHDREQNFHEAKLIHAIHAVAACTIMLFAQYGRQQATRWGHDFAYFFEMVETPNWCPSEIYTHPYDNHATGYTAVNFAFS